MRLLIALCCLASLAAADWTSARGPLGSGLAPDGPAPPLKRLWRAQLGSEVGPLAIAGGKVVATTLLHGLVCLDLADGRELWRTAEREPTKAAPLIADDAVVVGDQNGVVRCWSLADGRLRWERTLDGKVLGGAVRFGATVLVGSYDQGLHALALADGTEKWVARTEGPVHAAPALLGGQALVGGCDGQVRRIDAATGAQLGVFAAGANIGAAPAIVGELAVVAVLDGRWFALAGDKPRWSGTAPGERFEDAPAADATTAVLVSRDGTVRALNLADGAQRWQVRLGVGVEAAPLIAGGHAWIADAGGDLRALALADGREIWRSAIASPLCDPAAAGGKLVVGAVDGSVWCFGPR